MKNHFKSFRQRCRTERTLSRLPDRVKHTKCVFIQVLFMKKIFFLYYICYNDFILTIENFSYSTDFVPRCGGSGT